MSLSLSSFDMDKLNWARQIDDSDPARPVDNSTAIVGGDLAAGRVDFFTKWAPNAYCPLHRHLGDTISVVLAGLHHVEEVDGATRKRPPGHYGHTAAGEYHWEYGGPEGSLVFFSVQSKDGRAFELLDKDGNAVGVVTVADLLSGNLPI
jgi:quercetin dioxygenase-like cupin family protein